MRWSVQDVMTSPVITVTPDTDFKAVAQLLRGYNIGAVPVVDSEQHVVGIVSEADLIAKASWKRTHHGRLRRWLLMEDDRKAAATTTAELMTPEVVTIGAEASLNEAARLMRTQFLKTLPVVTGDGRLVGIISRADVVKTYARDDAEIRREIRTDVLREKLWIDTRGVDALVEAGRVTLVGLVESRSLAEIAGHLAEAVPGVVAVDNRLQWSNDDRHARFEQEPVDNLRYTGAPLR
jgi:CBS-domain-containing membrane protein